MDSDNNMASILKRKRAPVEVLDTPKRAKSSDVQSGEFFQKPSGWNAAFRPPKVTTNGEAKHLLSNGQLASPDAEAIEFDHFVTTERNAVAGVLGKKKKKEKKHKQKAADKQSWRISSPIGGRMIDADPVFTADEKYFIVANRTTLHVYATSNSLLTRSIRLNLNDQPHSRIVAFNLSPTHSNLLWISCSDGIVFCVDWTSGAGAGQHWITSSTGCNYMTVASMESVGRRRDVVFTTELRKSGGYRITANELPLPPAQPSTRMIYTSPHRIEFLQTAHEGSVIVGVSGNKIFLGLLRSNDYDTVDKIRYEFRVFESADPIKSLDMRVSHRTGVELAGLKKSSPLRAPIVDLVVGDVKGVVFIHDDLLAKLFYQSQNAALPSASLVPRKLHWHRQAVQTVKWSLDGNYVISGGSETVLVLWQLDTGKQQFLPHMSATIQNVALSPTGTSYGIQLGDNSAMILSTAELAPTTNISGIQSNVIESEDPVESAVLRVDDEAWGAPVLPKTPAVVNPLHPSRLLLGVGLTQKVRARDPLVLSNPFLQTFDLASGHSVSRQAMTRNNITNINTAPNAHRLSEPRITHMEISHDGTWLATVDEWYPPLRDLEHLTHEQNSGFSEQQNRREVHLKFWQWTAGETWELVSRINNAHHVDSASSQSGKILGLAVDPSRHRFSTIGQDNVVRTWTPKIRKRDGVIVRGKDNQPLKNWSCEHNINLDRPDALIGPANTTLPDTGSVAFSEDGSIIAAAVGNSQGILHLLDPDSGTMRHSLSGLFGDEIFGLEFLGQDLIILSDTISVYDVVAEEMRLSMQTSNATQSLSTTQKREMMILAVDRQSRTFALALPKVAPKESETKEQSLRDANSELIVFHQDSREPRFKRAFDTLITAVIPTVGSEGYLVLDGHAQIHTVLKKGTQAVTTLAQSTSALQLDVSPEEAAGDLLRLVEAEDEEMEDELEDHRLPTPSATQGSDDEDDNETPVVTHQKLAEVFDIGPAFVLPPMEEMFYQVAGLFSSKPLPQSVA